MDDDRHVPVAPSLRTGTAMATLDHTRVMIAAQALGIARERWTMRWAAIPLRPSDSLGITRLR
jgi:alkylation response protein AidB-like acyl-CoA dehydrogenase